jgi:hypothetical protein
MRKGGNGKVLNVRCACMAQTREWPSPRFTGYDILGTAGSLAEAVALWREHAGKGKPGALRAAPGFLA